jgi:hypothetical protein
MNNENKINMVGGSATIAKKSLHSVKRYNSGVSQSTVPSTIKEELPQVY